MSREIAGILFDIGGVLVALDGVVPMAKLLGIEPQHEALHAIWIASPHVVAHETGKIEAQAFAEGVVADLGLPVTAEVFLRDFLDWPSKLLPGALRLLDEIPCEYRLAALSPPGRPSWPRSREWTSHHRRSLFLDDGARNVEAAVQLGMHGHLATGPDEARRVLVRYGVVPAKPAPLDNQE
jgi:FMN phosphatase YigB (HAD superfamily)